MSNEDETREGFYKAVESELNTSGRYTADVNETGDGFAVWDVESGDLVRECGSLENAVKLAQTMNREE
jgi:hypothetical protein